VTITPPHSPQHPVVSLTSARFTDHQLMLDLDFSTTTFINSNTNISKLKPSSTTLNISPFTSDSYKLHTECLSVVECPCANISPVFPRSTSISR